MDEFKVPIYLMTGFLESGKTSFLNFTLAQEYFQIDEPTLLILCEEGEEEYDKIVLKKCRTSVEVFDSIEELTQSVWLLMMHFIIRVALSLNTTECGR